MDWQFVFFHSIGGLGMLIYGMTAMSESLQRLAGERMKAILGAVSTNRILAFLSGVGVTAVIQSSSATTVMLVGFVNAGLMSTVQAVGVALGAHIGTTLTAQLMAFNITGLALPAIGFGSFMRLFSQDRLVRELGSFFLGLGLLFYGMELTKAGVGPFKESGLLVELFTRFKADSLSGIALCVLVGAGCTVIIQASSVTVGLTMALATQGLLTFPGAAALVIGDNIGTTITAELAALKTDLAARRMARTNSVSNIIGATYMIILFPFYIHFVEWFTQATGQIGPAETIVNNVKPNIAHYIANAHTIFNIINATIMVSALPLLVKIGVALTPHRKEIRRDGLHSGPLYLNEEALKSPTVALSLSRRELIHMTEISHAMATEVFPVLVSRRHRDMQNYAVREATLNTLRGSIHHYLVQLFSDQNTPIERSLINAQMAMATNIERLGDTINDIADLISNALDNNVHLSNEAMEQYQTISNTALEFYDLVTEAIKKNRTDILPKAQQLEDNLDKMRMSMRSGHLERLQGGNCGVEQGLIFTDLLNYFDRLGDHLLKVTHIWVEKAASNI